MAKKGSGPRIPGPGAAVSVTPAAPVEPELILVRSPDGKPFWERHVDHPGHEVWVAGNNGQVSRPVQVALTDAVKRALREGRLERAEPAPPREA